MMKKLGSKIKNGKLEHVVDFDEFMNDDKLREKYGVEINRITYSPYDILSYDDFVASAKKFEEELKQEETD